MAFASCRICGKYDFLDRHRCAPVWKCRAADDGDWRDVHAVGEDAAACEFAERWDREVAEGALAYRGRTVEVEVQRGDGLVSRFWVSGEMVPTYRARATV